MENIRNSSSSNKSHQVPQKSTAELDETETGGSGGETAKPTENHKKSFLDGLMEVCPGAGKCPNVSHHPTNLGIFYLQQIYVLVMSKIPILGTFTNPWCLLEALYFIGKKAWFPIDVP